MADEPVFDQRFLALTGNDPFSWQREMYRRIVAGDPPKSCQIPTGLGKTSVMAIWLIALARNPNAVPRRLVYVVNRRTVVDQSTKEAENLRANLDKVPDLRAKLSRSKSLV
jgi:CRISPR-associated endonuclease/helicase Cas3